MSTLKGLCLDATPTGLTDDATYPQGRPQKTRPTLGFVTQPRCGCLPGASDCIFPGRFKCINSSVRAEARTQESPRGLQLGEDCFGVGFNQIFYDYGCGQYFFNYSGGGTGVGISVRKVPLDLRLAGTAAADVLPEILGRSS